MLAHPLFVRFLRFAFHAFYNPFAFTYDWVSTFVSRGCWRAWTRTAIPRLAGTRVLELASGTGNLLLDLCSAGHAPVGVDSSASMLHIAYRKLQRACARAQRVAPSLVRARAQALPFASSVFDSVVMTFPPSFAYDPCALAEIHRLLDENGRLVWVDMGRLVPCDVWSRALNRALDAAGEDGIPFASSAHDVLARAGFESKVETVQSDASTVMVVTATKGGTK